MQKILPKRVFDFVFFNDISQRLYAPFYLEFRNDNITKKKKNLTSPRGYFSKQMTKHHVFGFTCGTVAVLCCRLKVCSVWEAKGQEMYEIEAKAKILLKVLSPVED